MPNTPPSSLSDLDLDSLQSGGHAFQEMLGHVDIKAQIKALKKEIPNTKSVSKKDSLVKKLKYLVGVDKMGLEPKEAYILNHMPVVPPLVRPTTSTGNNRIEYADVNWLYKDHMAVNMPFRDLKHSYGEHLSNEHLANERKALYQGAAAIMGVGEALTGNSRGKQLKGFIKQIAGDSGPKGGYFQSKILSKKQDFSGRGTIFAEPNLGFNEMAIPKDALWTKYEFHIIRDLVKNGYDYVSAKKAVKERTPAAQASFNKVIKTIPIIANRAPTLFKSNVTAHYPVPIEGKTFGVNPLHFPMYAADVDGDAFSVFTPITPEAIAEAKEKLLPEQHMYDARKGMGASMIAPGHEAILGSMHITEPDMKQETVKFKTEEQALAALKAGKIKENTPIVIG